MPENYDRADRMIAELRADIDARLSRLDNQVYTVTSTLAATQAAVSTLVAVSDERQRQYEMRQNAREKLDAERYGEWQRFMVDSREDRQKIRDTIRDWAIRCLVAVLGVFISIIGTFVAAGGLKLLGI